MTDANQLLREYVESGSEPAFRELVSRYVDLVYSVALRRMRGNESLARDVAQMVFTDLARKASRLRAGSSLGGWLHRHTCFVCSTLHRTEQRRMAREQMAVAMNQNEPSEAVWQQLAPLLDEAIDQLSEADRQAIVLRFYERRDLRAVGAALGTSEDAAQKRLSRALEKLRELLASRGVSLSLAALVGALTTRAVSAAPSGLAAQAAETALAAAATGGFVATLMTFMTSWKIGTVLGAAAAVVAGALIYNASGPDSAKSSSPLAPPVADRVVGPAQPGTSPLANSVSSIMDGAVGNEGTGAVPLESNRLRLTILAADSGQPVPGVQINYRGWEKEEFHRKQFVSNRGGVCDVEVPRATITHLELTSVAEGFADTRLDWQTDRGETIPATYTLRLIRPVPISGRVLDPDGQPLVGAKMGWNHQEDPASENRPESHRFGWIEVETDSDGRWKINRVAAEMLPLLYGSPRHPDHVAPPLLMVSENRAVEQQLRDGTHVFRMARALSVSGTVVKPDGQPVAKATVRVGGVGETGGRETQSLPDGSFTVDGCKPGRNVVTAESAGFAASSVQVDLSATTGPVRVVLQPGRTLKLRLVDKAGSPIAGANVWYDTMRQTRRQTEPGSGQPSVQVEFNPKTDAEGRAVWEGAPEGDLYFSFAKAGYMRLDDVRVPADGREHVVTLSPALVVFGTVRDADTGNAIPKFRIVCGWPSPGPDGDIQPRFSNIDRFWLTFANGEFRHSFEEPLIMGMKSNPGYMLRFEAEGYAPALSRVIKEEEGEVKLDVELSQAADLAVTLLLPDGQPAAGIDVALATAGRVIELVPGGLSHSNEGVGGLIRTDPRGVFKLPADDTVQQVVAASSAGYAQVPVATLRADPHLQLQPWGRIEGTFASGSRASGRALCVDAGWFGPSMIRFDSRAFQARTDAQGRFAFPQVPPGRWKLVRLLEHKEGAQTSWAHLPIQEIEVQPGQTTRLLLGAGARPVVAQVRLPEGLQRPPGARLFASIHTPVVQPPAEVRQDPQALHRWMQLPEVRSEMEKVRSYFMTENADGTWMAEEVAAGDYLLSVSLLGESGRDGNLKPIAAAEVPVSVRPGNLDETLDAGEVVLRPVP